MLRNMSCKKAIIVLVWIVMELKPWKNACMAVARAPPISNEPGSMFVVVGQAASQSVFNTITTFWCINAQITLDSGSSLVVRTDCMLNNCNSCWKTKPVNSHPFYMNELHWLSAMMAKHGVEPVKCRQNHGVSWCKISLHVLIIIKQRITTIFFIVKYLFEISFRKFFGVLVIHQFCFVQ